MEAKDRTRWLAAVCVQTLSIEPGNPRGSGYCESFNSKPLDEFLNGEMFYSLKEAQILTEHWGVGDGPLNALDGALRAALVRFYQQIEQVRLTAYKVRIIDSTSGTAAKTRVLIESSADTAEWGTVGVNDNIVEASL